MATDSDVLERAAEYRCNQTHWEGCESIHVVCALVAEVRELRADRAEARLEILDLEMRRGLTLWVNKQTRVFQCEGSGKPMLFETTLERLADAIIERAEREK